MKTKIINGHKVNIFKDDKINLEDDIPDVINVKWEKPLENNFVKRGNKIFVEITSDVARHFKNSKEINLFLKNQIKHLQKIAI